jgi:hypothetical protein
MHKLHRLAFYHKLQPHSSEAIIALRTCNGDASSRRTSHCWRPGQFLEQSGIRMDIHGQRKAKQRSAQKYQEDGCRRKKKTHHRTFAQSDLHRLRVAVSNRYADRYAKQGRDGIAYCA